MNTMAAHPVTRHKVVDRLRGTRRLARKIRDRLRAKTGPMTSLERHNVYEMTETLIKGMDSLKVLLDEAKPVRKKVK